MNAALIGIIVTFLLTVILAYPLGKYIANTFGKQPGDKNYINGFEKFIFQMSESVASLMANISPYAVSMMISLLLSSLISARTGIIKTL